MRLFLIDVAPEPAGMGVLEIVVLAVIASVILLAAALVAFIWFRKRSLRHLEIGRSEIRHPEGPQ